MAPNNPSKSTVITDQVAESITRVEELGYEIKVREVMNAKVKCLEPSMTMRAAVEMFRKEMISGAPVVTNDGKLVGVVSMEDLIHCLCQSDLDSPVEKYMTHEPITVREYEPVVEALKTFVNSKVGRLVVLNAEEELAGILTKGDITRGFLSALQRDYEHEELRKYRARHLFEDINSDRSSLILRYTIKAGDFTHGGQASSNIKRALLRLGASPQLARRVGIAVYEAEINLIIHTNEGGIIRAEIEPHRISIRVFDNGPGIENVELAMQPGYSTATEEIRELGFGAGMGLVNIARCVDNMALESVPGSGTRLRMKFFLDEESVGEGMSRNKETS